MPDLASDLARHFSDLDDPRIDRTERHSLLDIIGIAICATLCGADVNDKREFLENGKVKSPRLAVRRVSHASFWGSERS